YQHDPVQTVKTNVHGVVLIVDRRRRTGEVVDLVDLHIEREGNVHGAINMLGLAKRTRAKIFQASTSEVYGDPAVHPQPE
ncbi:GDP-mannose 4,6-dehydratase, partial [Rhizobium ruizarguesonis]